MTLDVRQEALQLMDEEGVSGVGSVNEPVIQKSAVFEDEDLAAKVIEIIKRKREGESSD